MEFLWGGMLVLLVIAVMWASRDRGEEEEAELEARKEAESWTLDSVEDTAADHEGE